MQTAKEIIKNLGRQAPHFQFVYDFAEKYPFFMKITEFAKWTLVIQHDPTESKSN